MWRRLVRRTGRLLRRTAGACATIAGTGYWPAELATLWEYDPRICPGCGRAFCCDLDWRAQGAGHWRVLLRCGNCGLQRAVVLPNADAARLEERLAADADDIARDIARLDAERMAAEVDEFIELLHQDRIAPGDFAAPPL